MVASVLVLELSVGSVLVFEPVVVVVAFASDPVVVELEITRMEWR